MFCALHARAGGRNPAPSAGAQQKTAAARKIARGSCEVIVWPPDGTARDLRPAGGGLAPVLRFAAVSATLRKTARGSY